MIIKNYLQISPAQAIWAAQSGKSIFKVIDNKFIEITDNKSVGSNTKYFIKLNSAQLEIEQDLISRYQTQMTAWSLLIFISSILILFNYDQAFNALLFMLSATWVMGAKSILFNTIKFHKGQESRKSLYLYGKLLYR